MSNVAPCRRGYLQGGRRVMTKSVRTWAQRLGQVNVVHGPIYDHNLDGQRDKYSETQYVIFYFFKLNIKSFFSRVFIYILRKKYIFTIYTFSFIFLSLFCSFLE